jgi:hypothetical protein
LHVQIAVRAIEPTNTRRLGVWSALVVVGQRSAPLFGGSGLARWIRGLLTTSGVLALGGLIGVLGQMRLRMIGVVGYAVVFPVAVGLLALLFHRWPRVGDRTGRA